MLRSEALHQLAELILAIRRPHPVRVAIDGIDAAGKTSLADEIAPIIEANHRPTIRASVDGFHRPKAERYRRGPDSPEGYYQDAFDYPMLHRTLLAPLGPDGDRLYRTSVFYHITDSPVLDLPRLASNDAVLLFDGVFLLRPELVSEWDFKIFVEVEFEVAIRRACERDLALFGSPEATLARYKQRYLPGQQLYFQAANPQRRADVIVDNNPPEEPRLIFPEK